MTDLPGLLERVMKCEGPDTPVLLMEAHNLLLAGRDNFADRQLFRALLDAGGLIDAALGLVERVLPEWQIEQITWVPVKGGLCIASIGNFGCADDYYSATTEQPTTPPLAILAAFLVALIANPDLARVKV